MYTKPPEALPFLRICATDSTRTGCVICGFIINDSVSSSGPGSWLGEFRAIYSCTSGTFVSGVGSCDFYKEKTWDNTWLAPSDPAMRWNDDDYLNPVADELPVMHMGPQDGRHGFVLHDACWHLLRKALQPNEIPLQRLRDVCASLPFPLRANHVCWGHDYGNLVVLDDQDFYPWEDRLIVNFQEPEIRSYAAANPYNIPELPSLFEMRLEHLPEWLPQKQQHDCFSRLPWEILEAIAIKLPTDDALGLRYVSKAFLRLLSSGIFWASRFEASGDRGFIFEKSKSRDATDWQSLYRFTSQRRSSPGLQNRKRIWNLILPLTDLLRLRLAEGPRTAQLDDEFTSLRWSKVVGDIKDEGSDGRAIGFEEGCRLFGTHLAYVPKDLSKISFSIGRIGDVTYVAGIRLIPERGPDICLGYVSERKEVTHNITALGGFVLAAGSRGIHALQVVSKDARLSAWVGRPNNSPITERLASFKTIAALEVGFDGYKIVSLGVLGEVTSFVQKPKIRDSSLRKAALWYPKVPDPELFLNEESFTDENPLNTGYPPLFWIHFGGLCGSYLNHITGVSVDCPRGLYGIEFHYDANYGPVGAYKLGRSKNSDDSEVLKFPIDGTGGERIETVEAAAERVEAENAYSFFKYGALKYVKITTNRKRSFYTGALSDATILKPLAIAPGTTLLGLYASQHPECGLISLGAISEAINTT